MRPDFESWTLDELRVQAGWFGFVGDYEADWSNEQLIAEIDAANNWDTQQEGQTK